jgi:squalene-hopene/tetraprenyl-beta-curcumene cyclase
MLPWVYSLFALKSLGYAPEHPVIIRGIKGLEDFIIEDSHTLRLQPATSPIWDTAWVVTALRESGLPAEHPALVRAARWLLKKEIKMDGDWRVKNSKVEPGGWSFEFENRFYPDIDDTAVVMRALLGVGLPEPEEEQKTEALRRGFCWLASMQSNDGGWAAFDRNNNKGMLAHIPFADFVTPLDGTCADVTAHVMECLAGLNDVDGTMLAKALAYIKGEQEKDGPWYGRWGVNYIYGTGLTLAGLRAIGEDMCQSYIHRAVSWLRRYQNPDGGWGESCFTYDNLNHRGIGLSTASQTAWALLGLLAVGESPSPALRRGINYLMATQHEDGTWREDTFTGTGFPRAFYLRYDLYRIYFPLIALVRYRASLKHVAGGTK